MSTAATSYRFQNPTHALEAREVGRKLAFLYGPAYKFSKRASIGGDQESQFEQSFASLAFAYLKDKAPKLLDYMIGFQLVDRNDDNTKAIGIFGFKVGEEWVYAPVFFLNGDLKGHELLYLKKQDQFVPMKENWVNYLLNRQPHMLGEGTGQSAQQLNLRQPNYNTFNFPPNKMGSWRTVPALTEEGLTGALPMLGAGLHKQATFFSKFDDLDERLNLKGFLSSHVEHVKTAMDMFAKYPRLKLAADAFYGPNLLREALLDLEKAALACVDDPILGPAVSRRMRIEHDILGLPIKRAAGPDVKIEFKEDQLTTDNLGEHTDEEREKLLRDGMLVTDNREETSQAYNVQQPLSLQNPTETGLYDVLVKGGKFKRCLIVIGPVSDRTGNDFATVVDVDSKAWKNVHPTQVFVRECEDKESFAKWLEQLPAAEGFETGGHYLVLGSRGMGTTPFEVSEKTKGDEDSWRVYWRDYCSIDRAEYLPPKGYSRPSPTGGWDDTSPHVFLNKRQGSKLTLSGRQLYVPTDSRKLTLKNPPKPKVVDDEILGPSCCCSTSSYEPDPAPIMPGNLVDLQLEIMQKTARLKIINNDVEVLINGDRPRSKRAALAHLILRHGFREDTARELLKQAEARNGVTVRVKYADPYGALMGGPGAPPFPEPQMGGDDMAYGVPSQYPQEDFVPVPDMAGGQADPTIYDPTMQPDQGAMQVAQQSQQTGQKEVFDTAMIGSMLKAVREDSLVDRYLPDLLKALDRLGRILFLFYWHSEEFQDRYGKADMPELEDSLRNAFESNGDIVLYLKQKQIEPFAGDEMGEPEIDETARN